MYKILEKRELTSHINLFEFEASDVAEKTKPGQFIIVRIDEDGERIPLTISDADVRKGTVTVVCHEVGKTTTQLGKLKEKDFILDLLGPLGKPARIERFGTVLCIGGGVMVAPLHYQVKAFREKGNEVIGIVGATTSDHLIFLDEMRSACNQLHIATDDGTKGHKGLDFLIDLLKGTKVDRVVAEGPVVMLKAASDITRQFGIPTVVNLIPLMVDGMGMCGACRVTVEGKTRFACVDGLEFDGHKVDFDELLARLKVYTPQEKLAYVFSEEGETN